jgi:predicted MFS family arabinose efflux permease
LDDPSIAARQNALPVRAGGGYGRDFFLYVSGQAVSVVGDRVATIALIFLIIRLSNSFAPALAIFFVSRALPTILGGLVVGVLADHFNRRRLMIGCDLGRAALLAVVPAVSESRLWALYPMVFSLFALTLVFNTAARAALPDVVPEDRMLGANAILSAIQTCADIAYGLGGILVVALSLRAPFYIDAATFLFSAVAIAAMRIPGQNRDQVLRISDLGPRIQEGVKYLLAHPFLRWSTFALAIAPIAGGAAFVLAPLYASETLKSGGGLVGPLSGGAFRFSVLEVSLGIGALAGSRMVSRLVRRWPRGTVFAAGLAGSGLADAGLAFTQNLYVACGLLAVSGIFTSLFGIVGMTLVQTLTPTEIRGRVVAARTTVINSALALGSAIGGFVLLAVSYRAAWVIEGGVIAAASLLVWLRADARRQE